MSCQTILLSYVTHVYLWKEPLCHTVFWSIRKSIKEIPTFCMYCFSEVPEEDAYLKTNKTKINTEYIKLLMNIHVNYETK